ncbi:MAG: Ser-Thr-rich GPI-anchored membrane family protein [Candidatus Komeilibacteria bacterium]
MFSKKIISIVVFLAFFGVLFCFNTPVAKAITVVELQQQIDQLMAQILVLQEQIKEAQGTPSVAWCHTFNTNLRIGDGGMDGGSRSADNIDNDITALIKALSKENFLDYDQVVQSGTAGSSIRATYFSETVASAVVGFQEEYKDEVLTPWKLVRGTGYVGSSTRTKLNQLYGCETTTIVPYVTITSPNGGEVLSFGKTYTITWKSFGSSDATIKIVLNAKNGSSVKIITQGIDDTGSYTWYVDGSGSAANAIQAGEYKIEMCKGNVCDVSDNYFSIVAASVSGCTDSDNGKDYYLKGKITGYDSYGGNINKIVTSEDKCDGTDRVKELYCSYQNDPHSGNGYIAMTNSPCEYGCKEGACLPLATDSDSSPDYLKNPISSPITPENYPDLFALGIGKGDYLGGGICLYGKEPNLTYCKPTNDNYTTYYDHCANDTQLNEAYVSNGKLGAHGVTCPDGCSNGVCTPAVPPSVTITSPNGGEKLVIGNTYEIKWNRSNLFATEYTGKIELYKGNSFYGTIASIEAGPTPNQTITESSYWKVGDMKGGIGVGFDYRIYVRFEDTAGLTEVSDVSDSYFSVIAKTTAPSVTVTSPSNGEIWEEGERETIIWKTNNFTEALKEDSAVLIDIEAYDELKNQIKPTLDYCYGCPTTQNSIHRIAMTNLVGGDVSQLTSDTFTWPWNIPADLSSHFEQEPSFYRLVVETQAYPSSVNTFTAKSDYFSIESTAAQSITIMSPNVGE